MSLDTVFDGSMLNNRELAALIWIGAAALWVLPKKKVREVLGGLVKAFLKPQILISLVVMLAWVGLELWIGVRFSLWNPVLAQGTILWTLGSAGVLLFNSMQIDSDSDLHFFRRTIVATVSVSVVVEFLVNMYVMSIPEELVLQSVLIIPVVIATVAGVKPESKSVKTLCEVVLSVIGLTLLMFAARQVYLDWDQVDGQVLLLEFALPIWLTVGLLPFLYIFSIYVVYETVFHRINWETSDRQSRWRSRLALLSILQFRTGTVRMFTGHWTRQLDEAPTLSAARGCGRGVPQ